jgi:hypothetical protein
MTERRGERTRETPDITIHDPDDVVGGVAGAGSGERATGTPNTIYNLSSVLFHALQGGASYDTYIEDAEREGDEELTEFFRRVREEDKDRAAEAQLLLADRTLTAPGTEDTVSSVAATGGSEPDLSPGTEPPGGLPDTEPRTEGAPSGDPRREYAVTEMPDEDLTLPRDAVPPDAPEPPGAPSRAEAGQPPRTEPISAPPGPGDVPPRRTEEAPSRTEEGGPLAEEVPSGTPPQTPAGDVRRGASPTEQERTGQPEREREEDEGLIDKAKDTLLGEEERGKEETGRGDRR